MGGHHGGRPCGGVWSWGRTDCGAAHDTIDGEDGGGGMHWIPWEKILGDALDTMGVDGQDYFVEGKSHYCYGTYHNYCTVNTSGYNHACVGVINNIYTWKKK